MPVVNYSDIRDQLGTGDVFTFQGDQPLDYMIDLMEEGTYSHVGLVVRDPDDNLYFWDAPGGGNTFPDPYMNGQSHTGCRAADLDTIIPYYMSVMNRNTFTWRQLTPPTGGVDYDTLVSFIQSVDGTPFPGANANIPNWILQWYLKHFPNTPQAGLNDALGLLLTYLTGTVLLTPVTGCFYCAQLAADTYMQLGLLSPTPLPPNGYAPSNFDDQPSPMILQNGASLGPVTTVFYDGPSSAQIATSGNAVRAGV